MCYNFFNHGQFISFIHVKLKGLTNSVFEQASVINLLVLNAKQSTKTIKILVFGFIFNFLLTLYLQKSC